MQTYRTILSSNRQVKTIEEQSQFFVFHRTTNNGQNVSGPFPLDDKRFSPPHDDNRKEN
jgi:hypothetical protein